MAIAIPNEGKSYFLEKITDETLYIKLFTNNITNDPSTLNTLELADMTEAVGGGYAEKSILSTEWTITETENFAYAYATAKRWDFTGVLTTNPYVYGYYIVDSTKSILLVVNRFVSEFYPYGSGAYYEVLPSISFTDIYTTTEESE